MTKLHLGFYEQDKSPEFIIERAGNRVYVDFSYILAGPSPFDGNVSIEIGSISKNAKVNSNVDNDLDLRFNVATATAKQIDVSFTMNDFNDGTTLHKEYSLIRYDLASKFEGGDENDIVLGSNYADVINGQRGKDVLWGNSGADKINGGGNHDMIFGGLGKDILTGGLGDDQFFFQNEKYQGRSVDVIVDFDASNETIWLDGNSFWALPGVKSPTQLTNAMFTSNFLGTAQDSNDHIIYERDTGLLLYDQDGRGGSKAFAFAELDARMRIEADNFMVY